MAVSVPCGVELRELLKSAQFQFNPLNNPLKKIFMMCINNQITQPLFSLAELKMPTVKTPNTI